MPIFDVKADASPAYDGSLFRSARATERPILLPVLLMGVDRRTVAELRRRFYRALNPSLGAVVLDFTEGSGRTRRLTAYYTGGMEGAEGETAGFTWARYGLQFTALDPWFIDPQEKALRWTFGGAMPLLSTSRPFLPVQLLDGTMGGPDSPVTLTNDGDSAAWPTWKLEGPIKSFSLAGPSGGMVAMAAAADGSDIVPAGRTLVIDTRPGQKTIKDSAGTNYWPRLDTAPDFWSIPPGKSQGRITVVTGSAKAAISVAFHHRYASFV